ncbi:MAG: DUF1064 domain-containing protein [Bacilli bacterium]|nr:DUF1064 domain-containing protein [Bacilli bacterium]
MDKRLMFGKTRIYAKKVYYVDSHAFESDKGTKNGLKKAQDYCMEHFISLNDIVVFDSEMEYMFFLYLKNLEKEGKVKDIRHHVLFPLMREFTNARGMLHNSIDYESDFVFKNEHDQLVVVDVKGYIEDVFSLKWALFDSLYASKGMCITCVKCTSRKNYLEPSSWKELLLNTGERKKSAVMSKLRAENKELKKIQREELTKKRLEERELARLHELRTLTQLTSAQRKRKEFLEEKYEKKRL